MTAIDSLESLEVETKLQLIGQGIAPLSGLQGLSCSKDPMTSARAKLRHFTLVTAARLGRQLTLPHARFTAAVFFASLLRIARDCCLTPDSSCASSQYVARFVTHTYSTRLLSLDLIQLGVLEIYLEW